MRLLNYVSNLSTPAQWLVDWVRGGDSNVAGVNISYDAALSYAPVWYAVSKISGHVGQLPIEIRRRVGTGSEIVEDHPAAKILSVSPNEFETPIVFKETLMMHALLGGNGRAAIIRRAGEPVELLPLLPNATVTCLVEGKKWHVVTAAEDDPCAWVPGGPSRFRDGRVYKIPDRDVLHVPGLGYNGFAGLPLLAIGKNVFGLGIGGEAAAGATFRNPKPGVIITAPSHAFRDENDARDFLQQFNEFHTGVDNAGAAALLREGMSLTPLGISAADAQWIEQRRFQRQEVALLFGLESILGDDDPNSYRTLEQKNLAYLSNCLMKWLCRWEQEVDRKLLAGTGLFSRFNTDALLRSDRRELVTTLGSAITSRIMSPNEAREQLGLNPYDGGDEFSNPAITPGDTSEDEDDTDEDDTDDDDDVPSATETRSLAIRSDLQYMAGVERRRVRTAATKSNNFLAWADSFYDRWAESLADVIRAFGASGDIAAVYCSESRDALLEVAGRSTPDNFAWAIDTETARWDERTEQLIDAVTEATQYVA